MPPSLLYFNRLRLSSSNFWENITNKEPNVRRDANVLARRQRRLRAPPHARLTGGLRYQTGSHQRAFHLRAKQFCPPLANN